MVQLLPEIVLQMMVQPMIAPPQPMIDYTSIHGADCPSADGIWYFFIWFGGILFLWVILVQAASGCRKEKRERELGHIV